MRCIKSMQIIKVKKNKGMKMRRFPAGLKFPLWVEILLLAALSIRIESAATKSSGLNLSPFLASGQISEARNLSRTGRLPAYKGTEIESYSGYFSLHEDYEANMFFWYFPAMNGNRSAPLILWLEGGPGASSMYSIFNENGPFTFTDTETLTLKENFWAQNLSMIYIESPLGTGFSQLSDPSKIDTSSHQTADNIYKFLLQFFQLFPEQLEKDFYVAGISYGGHFAPAAAIRIHRENQKGTGLKVNLKGVLLESPWTDPVNQMIYADYLSNMGFINGTVKEELRVLEDLGKELLLQGRYLEATELWFSFMGEEGLSYFEDVTGLKRAGLYNWATELSDPKLFYYSEYVTRADVQEALHAGDISHPYINPDFGPAMAEDLMVSFAPEVRALLEAEEGYKVVVYVGQLDIICNFYGVHNFLRKLEWSGQKEFLRAERKMWEVDGRTAGYVWKARNLRYALVRNVGHGQSGDNPREFALRVTSGLI